MLLVDTMFVLRHLSRESANVYPPCNYCVVKKECAADRGPVSSQTPSGLRIYGPTPSVKLICVGGAWLSPADYVAVRMGQLPPRKEIKP